MILPRSGNPQTCDPLGPVRRAEGRLRHNLRPRPRWVRRSDSGDDLAVARAVFCSRRLSSTSRCPTTVMAIVHDKSTWARRGVAVQKHGDRTEVARLAHLGNNHARLAPGCGSGLGPRSRRSFSIASKRSPNAVIRASTRTSVAAPQPAIRERDAQDFKLSH